MLFFRKRLFILIKFVFRMYSHYDQKTNPPEETSFFCKKIIIHVYIIYINKHKNRFHLHLWYKFRFIERIDNN